MTAAPPKPVTRIPVPWDPWCWLEVQIATITGSTGDPDRVGYWQEDPAHTTDERYTVWQADGVAIPPDGGTVPSGYGEWTGGVTGTKWSPNWSTITWRAVDCNLMAADFSTGNAPWDWNASPGNGTLRLNDPDHVYFPGGPGSGWFDDIGVNTPIRVVAHLTAAYDQNPANAAKRLPDRVLATGLIRSITHDLTPAGTASTTINFSEPHVLYGRVNREAIHLAQAPHENYRFEQIQGLSDDPETGLLDYPRLDDSYAGDALYAGQILMQATDVGSDLWTEICKSGQSGAYVMGLRLYENAKSNGSPRVHAFIAVYPKEIGTGVHERSYGLDTRVLTTGVLPRRQRRSTTRTPTTHPGRSCRCARSGRSPSVTTTPTSRTSCPSLPPTATP